MYISIKYVPSLVFAIVSSAVVTTGGVSEVTFGDCLACNISCLFLKESTYVNVYICTCIYKIEQYYIVIMLCVILLLWYVCTAQL